LGGLLGLSLIYSIWFTAKLPLYAFFSTFTRAWEFAAGALLAVWLGSKDAAADRTRAESRSPIWWWLGVALITVAFITITNRTPYPSFWAAIPVAGAVLFLFGGESKSRWVPRWLMRFKPIQFLGDISYSLYLWHWPILMLAPWFIIGTLNDWQRGALVALAIVLAWVSKRLVEDPIRFGRISRLSPYGQLSAAGLAMIVVLATAFGTTHFAKAALSANGGEDRVVGNSNINNGINFKPKDNGNCLITRDSFGFKACNKGDLTSKIRVGFIGDSHTRQYFTPVDNLAYAYHWQLTMISKSACPIANTAIFPASVPDPSCKDWNAHLQQYLAAHPPFDLIINSNSSFVTFGDQKVADAYAMTVKSQLARGTKWLVINDNPKPIENFIPCIAAAGSKANVKCANTRQVALTPPDVLPGAIKTLAGVTVADFTNVFCHRVCSPVIHDVMVYRDKSHITSKFARLLQPKIRAVIPAEFKQ
ncbi:MAG: hypothetical protein RL670_136, partial [Actinomycetota bacterium]